MATQVISVKLTETELLMVDQLVHVKNFDSRSAVIRGGIGLLMDKYHSKKQAEFQIEDERRKHRPRMNRNLKRRPMPKQK